MAAVSLGEGRVYGGKTGADREGQMAETRVLGDHCDGTSIMMMSVEQVIQVEWSQISPNFENQTKERLET